MNANDPNDPSGTGDPGAADSADGADTPKMPQGSPRWVVMDGILDGRIGDGPAITAAVKRLNRLGICEFELEQDGGKYSLLPGNDRVDGAMLDATGQQDLLDQLRVIAAATHGAVESTLRCTMIYQDECAETLFRAVAPPPAGDGIEPLTRLRPVTPADLPQTIEAAPPWQGMLRRKEVMIALPLLLLAFALGAWQSGLLDRLLSASADGLSVEAGPFEGLVVAEVANDWGNYQITVRRGPEYPTTSEAWDARTPATETERLRDTMVREGQELWLQLRDKADAVLAQRSVSLRPFVTAADAEVETFLPGRMTATRLVFSLTEYEKKKKE